MTFDLTNFPAIRAAVRSLTEDCLDVTTVDLPCTPQEMAQANAELAALPVDTDYETLPATAERVLEVVMGAE